MAYENDILTRNDDDELSVRVVQSTGDNPAVAYDDVYTRDDNGKLAVRVVGAGGGDSHNKGSFLTPEALRTAYPTAQPGDFAIVESTDTVWVWDSDTSGWKDGDTKGQVISVNNQTGAVTLTASDVGAATSAQGAKADTAVQPGDLATVATTGAYSDLTGTPTIPTVGNGTITITQGGVTKGTFTTNQSGDSTIDVDAGGGGGLPSQTGQSGKFLTTDGTDASWATISALQNTATSPTSLTILGNVSTVGQDNLNIGQSSTVEGPRATAIGVSARSWYPDATALGYIARADKERAIAIGAGANVSVSGTGTYGIAIGYSATVTADSAIQIGGNGRTNSESGTLCIGSGNNNYKLLDADGTIPSDRLPNAINKYSSMPTAASTNLGWIVQYTGTTDSTYTHGYIYECVSDGGNPATYSWSAVSVQAGGGGSLPSQTGNAGKFLTTDGTDASWGAISALQNTATGTGALTILGTATNNNYAVNIGTGSAVTGEQGIALGRNTSAGGRWSIVIGLGSSATGDSGVAIGDGATATGANTIQLGSGSSTGVGTFSVGFGSNKNYQLLSNDGTIPEARLADTTNATTGDVLQLDSNGNAVWAAGGGGGGLPSQTGNSGKFLTTDGTDASWSDKPLVNKATKSTSVTILGTASSASSAVNIGVDSQANESGAVSLGNHAQASGRESAAIGYYSGTGSSASRSVAILGWASHSDSIAIGVQATTGANNVIQIGRGTNSESGTMCVGVYRNNIAVNYKLLDNDGTIPAARHATLPAADGTYTLQLVITNGVPTLSWVAV